MFSCRLVKKYTSLWQKMFWLKTSLYLIVLDLYILWLKNIWNNFLTITSQQANEHKDSAKAYLPQFSPHHWCRISEHSRSQNTHIYLASREKSESCTENCLFYPQQNNKRTPNPLSTTLFTANRYTIHIANALLWFRLQRLRLHSGSYYIKVHHNKYVHIQYKYNNI